MELQTMVCGIQKTQMLALPGIQMLTEGSVDNQKSTSGGCFYLGNNLVSWMSKKQNFVSFFIAAAKYIVAGSCCT